ncbi:unnamed protein product [Urochloa humidicola]
MAHHHLRPAAAILAVALLLARAAGYPWPVCGQTSNFKPNSTYQANLDLVAAALPKNVSNSPDLFSIVTVGAIPEQVWAMGLCRGDVNATACLGCVTQAVQDLPSHCPYYKEATIYYDTCTLHYSDVHTLAGDDDTGPRLDTYSVSNMENVTSEPARFRSIRDALVNATAEYAANNSTRRFATGEADFDHEFPKIYSAAQCRPDETAAQCRKCLDRIVERYLLGQFQNNIGGRVLEVDCTYRFETAPFYNGPAMVRLASSRAPAPAEQPTVGTTAAGRGSIHKKVLIILVASITVFLAVLAGCFMLIVRLRKRTGKRKLQLRANFPRNSKTEEALRLWRIQESSSEFTLYGFSELAAATGDFSDDNLLGRGGFGPVYKGKLGDRAEVAVKRLAVQSGQGLQEFKNEIQLIAKLQHTNLVRLLGCCVQEEEKMLVYEYMPNRSLDLFIFDQHLGELLDWKKRLHIIEGTAQGILYLHKHSRVRIIHRDLKASNILLDKDLNAKISDFGMARIFASDTTVANTNRVVGTYGYMAPEYASEGIFSVRSDVFSFGVLLLEIVSGKRNNGHHCYGDFFNLLGYAWHLWREGRALELIDPLLGDNNDVTSILRCVKVALLCVQDNAIDRPRMTEVMEMLGHDGTVLPDPKQPPHFHLRVSDDNAAGGEDGWEAQTQSLAGSFI